MAPSIARARGEQVTRLVGRGRGDHRPAMGALFNQPHVREASERLADDRARDTEELGERHLLELRPRRQAVIEHGLVDRRADAIVDAGGSVARKEGERRSGCARGPGPATAAGSGTPR